MNLLKVCPNSVSLHISLPGTMEPYFKKNKMQKITFMFVAQSKLDVSASRSANILKCVLNFDLNVHKILCVGIFKICHFSMKKLTC